MSYTNLNAHIVFSTRERRPFLNAETMERLAPYIGGILRDKGAVMLAANGPADHIHIVATLPATAAPADIMRTVKAVSSKRMLRSPLRGFCVFVLPTGG
jgi:REP element-mobilizing transposase RayT